MAELEFYYALTMCPFGHLNIWETRITFREYLVNIHPHDQKARPRKHITSSAVLVVKYLQTEVALTHFSLSKSPPGLIFFDNGLQ